MSTIEESPFLKGLVVPGLPHLLLAPERNPGWKKVEEAYKALGQEIMDSGADVIVIYSTYWASILGHQIQARPEPEFTLVDDQFHDLGSIPYKLKIDTDLAKAYCADCVEMGLKARATDYEGFPIDTGSVVALKLLNPDNKIPAVIVSSNIYSDRAETVVLGKALSKALKAQGKKAVAVAVTSLSNRLFTKEFDVSEDRISSRKDEEWNQKFLEFLEAGKLEDVSQLSRQFHREARVHKVVNFKPFWWLSSVMGAHNRYEGKIWAYAPICGTGAAVVSLTPSMHAARDLEFDEDSPEYYHGERNVLGDNLNPEIFDGEREGQDESL